MILRLLIRRAVTGTALWRTALIYGSGSIGAGIFYALNNFILPTFLSTFSAPAWLIGLLSGTRSFEGAIIQPLVGAWSDRTWTPLGRRRPFIIVFVPISAAFIALTPFVPRLSGIGQIFGWPADETAVVLIALSVFLFTLTFNIMYDPYLALLADTVPTHHRGTVNGIAQALLVVGEMMILGLGVLFFPLTAVYFLFAAGTLVLFFVPTVLGITEQRHLSHTPTAPTYSWREYWSELRRDRQIQWYFLVQFFFWFGINGVTPFLTLYVTKVAHFTYPQALTLALASLLTIGVLVWPLGMLSDAIGLQRVFLLGMICLSLAAIGGALSHDMLWLYGMIILAGVGNAAQTATSFPLLTRLAPPHRIGLYTGLNSTVTSIAAPGSAVLLGVLIEHYGYTILFPYVAVMFLATIPPLLMLRIEN